MARLAEVDQAIGTLFGPATACLLRRASDFCPIGQEQLARRDGKTWVLSGKAYGK